MPRDAIETRLLPASQLELLANVDDVFDNPVRPELAARYLETPGNLLAVAIHSGTVIGMASAISYVHPDKPLQLFVNEVGVAGKFQGQGIASRLLRLLLDEGRRLGCTEAWVATEENNTAARALYQSLHGVEDADRAIVYTWRLNKDEDAGS